MIQPEIDDDAAAVAVFRPPPLPSPVVTLSVILLDEELPMAQAAVRQYLGKIRNTHRRNVACGDEYHAEMNEAKYDRYLDLYERLGGDRDSAGPVDAEPRRT